MVNKKFRLQIGDKVRILSSDSVAKQFQGLVGEITGINYIVRISDIKQVTGLEEYELSLMNGDDCPRVTNEISETE